MVTDYCRGSFSSCLHQPCLPCHVSFKRDQKAVQCCLSYSETPYMRDFRINPFFNLLEVTPCLLVKPVRKKVDKVLWHKKNLKNSINNVLRTLPLISCTDPWQKPTVSQITSSSKQVSLHFHQENRIRGGLCCLPQQRKNEWALLALFVQEIWLLICIKRWC